MSRYAALAKDIYRWCKKKNLWCDIIIYFDGKAWSSSATWGIEQGKEINENLYEFENRNPKDYFEFVNPETLSMSFEGRLYHVLNGYVSGWSKLTDDFGKVFDKHDCYYEMGHAWNLSVYENQGGFNMIIPANQIKCTNSREEIIDAFCGNLMSKIQEYAKEGRHDCCFTATAYYECDTGKLYATYQSKWKGNGSAYDPYKYHFDDYASEIKKRFKDAGYVIKPTGYIGGVWQLTEDICW